MPDYLLPCSCGQTTRITAAQAGTQVACVCGERLPVPTLRGIRELKIAPPQSSSKRSTTWTPVHGALFASGLAIASIGAVFLAYFGLLYIQLGGHPITRDLTAQVI